MDVFENIFSGRTLSEVYLNRYKLFGEDIIADIEGFTESLIDIINDEDTKKDILELEEYREFEENELRSKGIFYSYGDKTLLKFPKMVKTSYLLNSDLFKERYMMPIKLLNGDIFTWIGYDPTLDNFKYRFPTSSDVCDYLKEGNLVGNLESIPLYKTRIIYVAEGLFDAYRVNTHLKHGSVALLGSVLTKTKYRILKYLKDNGYILYFLPDYDAAGGDKKLLNSDLWTKIISYRNKNTMQAKDFDAHVKILRKLGLDKNDDLTAYL